ncbi:hypothetical protein NM688_g6077 [Phlebia brevispora]|uniref:Uncharacterized protein n=1 Tax=Phlebia brevispora TaxID=194682 RepID=A0ACC1SK84_9APHY|nr:hypothetical protein NM688_g6077 [Phlebia brevispora]
MTTIFGELRTHVAALLRGHPRPRLPSGIHYHSLSNHDHPPSPMSRAKRPGLWSISSYILLSLFLTVFLFLGLLNQTTYVGFRKPPKYDFPDFDGISTFTRVLSEQDVNLNDPNNRIIIIGDVHGMNESLHDLLDKLSYDPSNDTLFFAGDLLAKSSHDSSLSVIDFLTRNHSVGGSERIFPVRGNHDQLVIQWRSWREWYEGLTLPATAAASHAPFFFRSPADVITRVSSAIRPIFKRDDVRATQNNQAPPVSTGREFLQLLEAEWALEKVENEPDPDEYVEVARKRAKGTWREVWWTRIPPPGKGKNSQSWNLFTDHYWLARDMTQDQASYLTSLPLVHHIPHLHLFIAHAGLLPSDPRLPPSDPRQPLTHTPHSTPPEHPIGYDPDKDVDQGEERDDTFVSRLRANMLAIQTKDIVESDFSDRSNTLSTLQSNATQDDLRQMQETALLEQIPQNRDSWVVLNMRGVRKKGKVTRDGEKGTPWSDIWNDHMGWCDGFDDLSSSSSQLESSVHDSELFTSIPEGNDAHISKKKPKYSFPCEPATVVYGHAASRGLDVKRWSMGIDTGCLYGRKLTALVLNGQGTSGGQGDGDDEDEGDDDTDDESPDDSDGEDSDSDDDSMKSKRIRFGDRKAAIKARLVSINCPTVDSVN